MEACGTPSVEGFAGVLVELLRELGVREAVLVGHSMGCRVVLGVWDLLVGGGHAVEAGRGVAGVVGSERDVGDGIVVKGVVLLDGSHVKLRSKIRFDDELSKGDDGQIDLFEQMFSPATPDGFRKATRDHVGSRDQAYVKKLRQAYMTWDEEKMDEVVDRLGKTRIPVLQLQSTEVDALNRRRRLRHGEDAAYSVWLKRKVVEVKQETVENAGHFPHVDQKEVVAQHIMEFVKETLSS